MNKTVGIVILFMLSGMAGLLVSWYQFDKPTSHTEPLAIKTYHYPARLVKQLAGDPLAGQKIFNEFCAACHAKHPIIDLIQTPKIGDRAAWQLRKKWGLPVLLKMTITGVGVMPARGGCFECSDQQLLETIQYILKESE